MARSTIPARTGYHIGKQQKVPRLARFVESSTENLLHRIGSKDGKSVIGDDGDVKSGRVWDI